MNDKNAFLPDKPIHTSEHGRKYQEIEYNGQPAKLYADGAIRGDGGRFLARHPAGYTITQENASALRARRIALAQEAAGQGLANAVMASGKTPAMIGTADAWMYATEQIGNVIMNGDDRDKVQAFRAISDVLPVKYDKTIQVEQGHAGPAVDNSGLASLLNRIHSIEITMNDDGNNSYQKQSDVIDADVIHSEPHNATGSAESHARAERIVDDTPRHAQRTDDDNTTP